MSPFINGLPGILGGLSVINYMELEERVWEITLDVDWRISSGNLEIRKGTVLTIIYSTHFEMKCISKICQPSSMVNNSRRLSFFKVNMFTLHS